DRVVHIRDLDVVEPVGRARHLLRILGLFPTEDLAVERGGGIGIGSHEVIPYETSMGHRSGQESLLLKKLSCEELFDQEVQPLRFPSVSPWRVMRDSLLLMKRKEGHEAHLLKALPSVSSDPGLCDSGLRQRATW
ncbi:MAG: hypothetical protein MUO50_19450, partial [Longimicrobiales bacterium]|nr:hypothetical protein [Longimicrobiales bacterium]